MMGNEGADWLISRHNPAPARRASADREPAQRAARRETSPPGGAVPGDIDGESFSFEQPPQRLLNGPIVLDDQDSLSGRCRRSRRRCRRGSRFVDLPIHMDRNDIAKCQPPRLIPGIGRQ